MSVAANIGYSLRLKKMPRAEIAKEVDAALGLVQLSGYGARMPAELSGGQRQRVNIARAIVNDPEVMLVDEPTSALDEARSAEIMRLLRDLTHDRQLATVVVTHDLAQLPLFDAQYEMHDGRLSAVRGMPVAVGQGA